MSGYRLVGKRYIRISVFRYCGVSLLRNRRGFKRYTWHPAAFYRKIENIAVSPDFRRRGIGKDLVNALKEKCEKIFLLVKEDNYGAIAFYASMGFVKTGVRRRYNHGKDAYVMELKV